MENNPEYAHGMYRRRTSVAVADFERELDSLLPIDEYFDYNEKEPRRKKRKSSQKSGGLKVKNRIDLAAVE
jgi:hypothetical protein